jgi:hypothetical protein
MTGFAIVILVPSFILGFILGRKWQRIIHWFKKPEKK